MLIQEMRSRSQGIIAKVIVGMIVVVFALFGFGSITTYLSPVPKVATVNGEDISRQEFDVAVERNRRLMLAQDQSVSEIDEEALRDNVLSGLVNRRLMLAAAEDLDLFYGDELINRDILATPVFQTEGIFNANLFRSVIGNVGYSPIQYKREMAQDKKIQQLSHALRSSAFLTKNEATRASSLAQQKRDMAYMLLEVEKLMNKEEVTEDEVKNWYQSRAEEYMTEETVDLQYLEIKRSDLMDKTEILEDEILSHYETEKESYSQGERRRFAHILIESSDEVSVEEARIKAQKVYEKILSGEDFAELAKTFSDDKGSAEIGGDLEFQEAETFVPEFEKAGYALSLNEVSDPVLTEFGYHLIKLLDIEPEVVPELADIHARIEAELKDRKAEKNFLDLSSKLADIAYDATDLIEPADELGLKLLETGHVSRSETQGLAANKLVMEMAYSPDLLQDGNNSDIIEITPDHHVVIRVLDHKPSELKTLSLVEDEIVASIARERATFLAEEQAKEIVAMLEDGSGTKFVADTYHVQWQVVEEAIRTQLGMVREINAEAFKLPRPEEGGKSVGYSLLDNGDAVVVSVSRVIEVEETALLDEDVISIAKVLASRSGQTNYAEFRAYYTDNTSVWLKENL